MRMAGSAGSSIEIHKYHRRFLDGAQWLSLRRRVAVMVGGLFKNVFFAPSIDL